MTLTGAQIVIETLIEQGVDTVFGYPGGAVLYIYDELYKNSDRITHFTTCHEQAAAHAADGYARVSGKVGVCFATSGPGATNLVTGIANAFLDSTPIVAITGNVTVPLLGKDSFQEVDIAGVTIPITKHSFIVKDVSELADTIRQAFKIATSGRPGPVLIDIPKDVQINTAEFTPQKPKEAEKAIKANDEALQKAVELIQGSEHPFIYAGGGAVIADASEELVAFCERIDAPVGCSMMGLTAMPYDHPNFLGMVGMHGKYAATQALYDSDLIISVGTRFSDRATGDKAEFSANRSVIQIDIDPAEMCKNIPANACLQGDVKTVLGQLLDVLSEKKHPEWHAHIEALKNSPDNSIAMNPDKLTPEYIIERASKFNEDHIVATDVGQHQMWATLYYPFKKPRTFITSGGLGTMGFGMGAAIGSCIADGNKRTLLFTSDGSFHMNMNELATAVSYDLPLVIVVLNNAVLGMVYQWQTLFYGARYASTDLGRVTDYVKVAEAFGAKGYKATTREEYDECLKKAYAQDGPVVIDCVIDKNERVLPMIPAGKGISSIILR